MGQDNKIWAFVYLRGLSYDYESNDVIVTFTNGNETQQRTLYVQNGCTTTSDDQVSFGFSERIDVPKVTIKVAFLKLGIAHKILAPTEFNFLEYFANNTARVTPLNEIKGEMEIKFNNSSHLKKPVSTISVKGDDVSAAVTRFLDANYIPEALCNFGTKTALLAADNVEFHVIFDFTSSNLTEHYKNGQRINLHDDNLANNPYKSVMCLLEERIGTFFVNRTPDIYGFGYQYRNGKFAKSLSTGTLAENLTEMCWSNSDKPKGIAACIETYEKFLKKFASEYSFAGPTVIYDVLQYIQRVTTQQKIIVIFTDGLISDIDRCPRIWGSSSTTKFLFVVVGPDSVKMCQQILNQLKSDKSNKSDKNRREGNYMMVTSAEVEDLNYNFKPVTDYIFSV